MKLLTATLRKEFSRIPFRSTDGQGQQAKVITKFFTPWGRATWLAVEGQPEGDDFLFFGWVNIGYGWEAGYFYLSELENIRGPWGLKVERDLYCGKKTVEQMMEE